MCVGVCIYLFRFFYKNSFSQFSPTPPLRDPSQLLRQGVSHSIGEADLKEHPKGSSKNASSPMMDSVEKRSKSIKDMASTKRMKVLPPSSPFVFFLVYHESHTRLLFHFLVYHESHTTLISFFGISLVARASFSPIASFRSLLSDRFSPFLYITTLSPITSLRQLRLTFELRASIQPAPERSDTSTSLEPRSSRPGFQSLSSFHRSI